MNITKSWDKRAENLWMSLYWEVYHQFGRWRVAYLFDQHPLPLGFASAEEAMDYVDNLEG